MSRRVFLRTLLIMLFLVLFAALTLIIAFPSLMSDADAGASLPTTSPTVIIDAGHGGEDGGALGDDGTKEKDLNLDIALALCDMLRAEGVNVIMTRTEDILLYDRNADYEGKKKVLDLRARLRVSEDNPGALFISIHMNAFPQKKYDGLQVYFPLGDTASEALAKLIQDDIHATLQPQNLRRPKGAGSNVYLLDKNPNTAVLIECGFLSNDAECARLNDAAYRRQLALIFYNSIMKYISDDSKSP
ncbi:MAG: N-acetylmuramoyl-L-alanine amidase [Clostridia bacterium]|nr:N-acetylmuramoyl-L-alanine amidase [Clostridia bacterium]